MEVTRNTLLGCPSGSVQGTALLLELDELLELLDDALLALDSDELGELRLDELLDSGGELPLENDDALLPLLDELALLTEVDDDDPLDPGDAELLDPGDDDPLDPGDVELLDGGVYELLEPRLDELDDELLLPGG